jgi:hypothetical protein
MSLPAGEFAEWINAATTYRNGLFPLCRGSFSGASAPEDHRNQRSSAVARPSSATEPVISVAAARTMSGA